MFTRLYHVLLCFDVHHNSYHQIRSDESEDPTSTSANSREHGVFEIRRNT
uniref:Uncharacterized protein n=1 Tax=Rhizophagus irregularis (strain DAOM 181602 / DAOM 197198 / MUCL 43194) TaxID=747089 RepID=U9U2W2_RHIID